MNGDIFSLSLLSLFCDSSTLCDGIFFGHFSYVAADDNIHDSELFFLGASSDGLGLSIRSLCMFRLDAGI